MPQLIEHVQHLAETIGPRPATTDAEVEAANYIDDVFRARGLEVEHQEFDCPRTYAWAFVAYHVLTLGAAVLSRWFGWPAFLLAVASAVLMWFDLDTRWGLSSLMPKGPSQNVIARHVPKARRNERIKRVVIVAHYDSAKSSLAFGPGMVKNFGLTFSLMKWLTFVTPVVIFISALPWTKGWKPWSWYATLAVAAYLLVPLLINVHREFFMHAVDGANDNASGVAAMLGVMERTVPEPESEPSRYVPEPPVRRTPEAAIEADVVLDDALLSYTPIAPAADEIPRSSLGSFGDVDWDAEEPLRPSSGQSSFDLGDTAGWDVLADEPRPATPAPVSVEPERAEKHGLRDWLGLGGNFDARREGKRIGHWENFSDEDEDDGFGLKGGTAGDAAFEDPEFAASEAARIRRRVTTGVDRALTEKEVWFVATGAEEVGTCGMQAFLKEYEEDLRDALIINLDNIGAGALHWVTSEGMARRYHCDRRLASSAKRVAREEDLPVRGRDYRGLSTDATPALARGFKAMSVMAFDINGRLPNWHWRTDTTDNVNPENLELAATFVAKLIREL
ncbi:MAG: M28 family peptidase [Actinobacteria bacterium]|nr:MAG: M28 family peptidase [Actinomycetota bacterium]